MSLGVRGLWQTDGKTELCVCAIFIALTMIPLSPSQESMYHSQHTQGEKRGGTRYIRNTLCSLCDKFCVTVNADAIMAVYLTTGNCCVDDSRASLFLWNCSRKALCVL